MPVDSIGIVLNNIYYDQSTTVDIKIAKIEEFLSGQWSYVETASKGSYLRNELSLLGFKISMAAISQLNETTAVKMRELGANLIACKKVEFLRTIN